MTGRLPSARRMSVTSSRTRHLVFMAHVWAIAPFLFWWIGDPRVQENLGEQAASQLRPVVGALLLYLVVRTGIAYRHPPRLAWEFVFPPIDIAFVSLILGLSHRGPMSNIALLYFLPMVQAAGSLSVRWSLAVGFLVILGLALATVKDLGVVPTTVQGTALDVLKEDKLNVVFRIYFLVVISSLMAFQARIAADLRTKLGVAADRARIAGDMHDGVQGRLIALAQLSELTGRVAESDPVRARELSGEGAAMARAAADELRFLVQRLRAPELEDGFVPALRQYAHNVATRSGLELEFVQEGEPRVLGAATENALFRIAQEELTNVLKHAAASQVRIVLAFEDDVRLEVSDDGCGLPERPTEGVGLLSMRERADEVGGSFALERSEEGGTRIRVAVPADRDAGRRPGGAS